MHESVGESTNVLNGADWWKCCSVEGASLTIRSWSNPGQGQLGRHRGVMRRKSCMTPSADIYSGSRSESEVRHLTISVFSLCGAVAQVVNDTSFARRTGRYAGSNPVRSTITAGCSSW